MKFKFSCAFILIVFALNISVFSQELSPPEIFKQSQADLVVVGKIDGYGRTYGPINDLYLEGTFARFQVISVLKGKYPEKDIQIKFPGHLGFADDTTVIIFITRDMKVVAGEKKLGNCLNATCYYSKLDWLLDDTKKNLSAVTKLFKIKK